MPAADEMFFSSAAKIAHLIAKRGLPNPFNQEAAVFKSHYFRPICSR
jgi:hypothetical protein